MSPASWCLWSDSPPTATSLCARPSNPLAAPEEDLRGRFPSAHLGLGSESGLFISRSTTAFARRDYDEHDEYRLHKAFTWERKTTARRVPSLWRGGWKQPGPLQIGAVSGPGAM